MGAKPSSFSRSVSKLSRSLLKSLSKTPGYLSAFAKSLPKFSWLTGALVLVVIVLVGLPMLRAAINGLNPFSAFLNFFSSGKLTIITSDAIIEKIEQVSELTTTKYTVQVVATAHKDPAKADPQGLVSGAKLLLIAKGRVEAGLDLAQLDESDITVSKDGKTVTVNLPPVKIFNHGYILSSDPADTYVYDVDRGVFTSTGGMETAARATAMENILASACKDGILEQATKDARLAVAHFLGAVVENVIVNSAAVPSVEQCKAKPASE